MNKSNTEKCTVTIKRIFDAPIQLVWEAWTTAEHIVNWWGPKGMKTTVQEHDFQEGGKWRYSMFMPDGREFISEGVYSEIIPPNRLVTSANFRPMTEGVILEVILEEKGEQTYFTFNVVHPTEAYKIQQEKMGIYNGWGSVFDRLDSLLKNLVE